MNNVTIVDIPERKQALYIDGLLVTEDRWLGIETLLRVLTRNKVLNGRVVFASETGLTSYNQFPANLCHLATRSTR